jgi:hypothetical protein
MDKKVLNERLNELIRQIRLNSKDAHFAEKLTDDLLSVHRQKLQTKSYVFDLGEELYKIERNSYYISKHERGLLFHVYNSMDLVIPISHNSLYGFINKLIEEYYNEYDGLSQSDRDEYDSLLEASCVILSMPINIFMDVQFAIDIATQVVRKTGEMYEQALSAELIDETVEDDLAFKEHSLRLESVKETIVDAVTEVKQTLEQNE